MPANPGRTVKPTDQIMKNPDVSRLSWPPRAEPESGGDGPTCAAVPKEARNGRSVFLGFWLPLILLQLIFAVTCCWSVHVNNGHLVYALDDPYIHMAIAKNVAHSHVWGVTPFGFSSASSSPLWVAVLSAVYFCFGVSVGAPLVLNLLFASLVLLVSWRVLRSHGMPDHWILTVQVLVICLTPLPFLIFDGMEHTLHTVVTILAVFYAARLLEQPEDCGPIRCCGLLGLAFLVSSIRYEGIFFTIAVAVLFLIRKRIVVAFLTSLAGTGPILLFGIWSVRHGWPLLPPPVVLKSSLVSTATLYGRLHGLIGTGTSNVRNAPHLLGLILLSLSYHLARSYRDRAVWDRLNVASAIFTLIALAHITCAGVGWGYRYEAYLVALGLVVVSIQLLRCAHHPLELPLGRQATLAQNVAVVLLRALLAPLLALGGLLSLILVSRGAAAFYILVPATHNIYEQQYQMARFVRKYYQGSSVALSDIGAVNFYADVHCLDLRGLASLPVAKAWEESALNSAVISRLARETNTRVAIVSEAWLYEPNARVSLLPGQWLREGTWTIQHNFVCASDKVTFFSVGPAEETRLARGLREFSSELPPDVVQTHLYSGLPPRCSDKGHVGQRDRR